MTLAGWLLLLVAFLAILGLALAPYLLVALPEEDEHGR